jgi:NADH-quinone oxidoreductase subunit K
LKAWGTSSDEQKSPPSPRDLGSITSRSARRYPLFNDMISPTLDTYLVLSVVLFAIGLLGVLIRRNTLVVFMCLELMLVASTLALVAFSRYNGTMDGNVFVFFILTVAAAEVAVGLAIIVALFRKRMTIQVDELNTLKN